MSVSAAQPDPQCPLRRPEVVILFLRSSRLSPSPAPAQLVSIARDEFPELLFVKLNITGTSETEQLCKELGVEARRVAAPDAQPRLECHEWRDGSSARGSGPSCLARRVACRRLDSQMLKPSWQFDGWAVQRPRAALGPSATFAVTCALGCPRGTIPAPERAQSPHL